MNYLSVVLVSNGSVVECTHMYTYYVCMYIYIIFQNRRRVNYEFICGCIKLAKYEKKFFNRF